MCSSHGGGAAVWGHPGLWRRLDGVSAPQRQFPVGRSSRAGWGQNHTGAPGSRRVVDSYSEVADGDRGHLVVLGCEVGGRCAPEALIMLRCLVAPKSRASPDLRRRSGVPTRLVSGLAPAVVGGGPECAADVTGLDSETSELSDALCADRECPSFSRLLPR